MPFLLDILVSILRTQEEKHHREVSQLKLELAEAQAELQQGKMNKVMPPDMSSLMEQNTFPRTGHVVMLQSLSQQNHVPSVAASL